MPAFKEIFKQIKEVASVLGTIVAIVGTVVALYVTSRLAPVAKDLSNLSLRVSAVEEDHRELVIQHNLQQAELGQIPVIQSQLSEVDKKIDRMSGKIDALYVPRIER